MPIGGWPTSQETVKSPPGTLARRIEDLYDWLHRYEGVTYAVGIWFAGFIAAGYYYFDGNTNAAIIMLAGWTTLVGLGILYFANR